MALHSLSPPAFQVELEFVQCLGNPNYLHFLAQRGYFKDEKFVNYLDYLQYWKEPEYVKYIKYPVRASLLNGTNRLNSTWETYKRFQGEPFSSMNKIFQQLH